jgi:hypothetical protein
VKIGRVETTPRAVRVGSRAPGASLRGTGLAIALAVTACAPDAWRPDPEFNRWTTRLVQECHPHSIGGAQLDTRLRQASFLNLASRLYFGKINAQQFTGSVNSFYPGDNRAAIECILARLPPTVSPR